MQRISVIVLGFVFAIGSTSFSGMLPEIKTQPQKPVPPQQPNKPPSLPFPICKMPVPPPIPPKPPIIKKR
jgi:hypothetical protein